MIKHVDMEKDNKRILEAIQGLSVQVGEVKSEIGELRIGQDELRGSVKSLEKGQDEMRGSIKSLEKGQDEMRGSIKSLEKGQEELRVKNDELRTGQDELRGSIKSLESGQDEMRGSIKSLEKGQEEIHEIIQEFSTHIDHRFDRLEGRVGKIEATMVTKDYLDDKLAEHGSRYGEIDRKTNMKIEFLADALVAEKSLSS